MKQISLLILFFIVFTGFVKSQNNTVYQAHCDSTMQSRIETGIAFSLVNRIAEWLLMPKNPECEIGTFLIEFTIDKEGKVINTEFLVKESSELSNKLKEELIQSVKGSTFSSSSKASKKQKGRITYTIKLTEE